MTSTMSAVRMRASAAVVALCSIVFAARPVRAQDPPPRIPWVVIDLHANIPRFPSDSQGLADSRGMTLAELPGSGLGAQVALNLYPLKWKAVTFGVGMALMAGRSSQTPDAATIAAAALSGLTAPRPAEEKFSTYAPQLSFNFGNGFGWSYISGGLGQSMWSVVPQGQEGYPPDSEPLKTLNYGGGARWFMKRHVGFSLDVRFYAISPGTTYNGIVGSPRTTLTVISAGVSVK